jgi:hypothetical protein
MDSNEAIDLNVLYRAALAGIHRAYVFMRFGTQGISVYDFEDTRLPGRNELLIVPEPMGREMLEDYLAQFQSWVVGNGLRELIETHCHFLDQVYGHALAVAKSPDQDRLLRTFEQASLREKLRRLRDEMGIDAGFSEHLESLTPARNALTHGSGVVRARDCSDGRTLVIRWRGLDVFFTGDDGVRYRIGDEPKDMELREPLEGVTVERERSWAQGARIELSAHDLAEITFMANHEAIEVLDSLRSFAERHGVTMKRAMIIRGGEPEN